MRGIEYYGFAFFVAILICLIAVLCKYLFADVKRQRKLLDEKESKLLKLYQSVEDVLEEFSDQSTEAREEIRRLVDEARAYQDKAMRAQADTLAAIEAAEAEEEAEVTRTRETKPKAPRAPKADAAKAEVPASAAGTRKRTTKSGAKAEGGVSFQKIIDEMENDAAESNAQEAAKSGRNEAILSLKAEGKSVQKIAQELGITQNEVKLVIGLNK